MITTIVGIFLTSDVTAPVRKAGQIETTRLVEQPRRVLDCQKKLDILQLSVNSDRYDSSMASQEILLVMLSINISVERVTRRRSTVRRVLIILQFKVSRARYDSLT